MVGAKASKIRLSAEELAYAMGEIGESIVAGGFLQGLYGVRCRDEISGRLHAASHGLMARGLLEVDLDSGTHELDDAIAKLARTIARTTFSIRCGRWHRNTESVLGLFFHDEAIVAHELLLHAVSEVTAIADTSEAVCKALGFLSLAESSTKTAPLPEVIAKLPTEYVDSIFGLVASASLETLETKLLEKLPAAIATRLAADFLANDSWGSCMRIEGGDTKAHSDRGFFFVRGSKSLWLLNREVGEFPMFALCEGLLASASSLLEQLVN